MSIATATSKVQYTLSAGAQALPVPFYFLENAHVQAYKGGVTPILLVLGTDYTLAGAGDEDGGTLTTIAGTAADLDAGDQITIKRNISITQQVNYVYNDRFPAETHERALDKLTMIAQQMQETIDRAVVFHETEIGGAGNKLPTAENRAGKVLGFTANGTALELLDPISAVFAEGDVIQCNTVTALKAVSVAALTNGYQAFVAGYASAGDGGGGIFVYQSASAETENTGTIVAPNAGTGRWKRVFDGGLNVAWFGATGDGSTDDSATVLKAVNAAATAGQELFFDGAKTYVLTTALAIPSKAKLRGNGASIKGTFNLASGVSAIVIHGFNFVGVTTTGDNLDQAIRLTECSNVMIRENIFTNSLIVSPSSGLTKTRISIINNSFTGTGTTITTARSIELYGTSYVEISGNKFAFTAFYEVIKISKSTTTNVVVTDNYFDGTGTRILEAFTCGGPINFSRNTVTITGGAVIYYKGEGSDGDDLTPSYPYHVVIADNIIKACAAFVYCGGAYSQAWEGATKQSCSITGNIVNCTLATNGGVVATIVGHHFAQFSNNVINQIGTPGNFLYGFVSSANQVSIVKGNTFRKCALVFAGASTPAGTPYPSTGGEAVIEGNEIIDMQTNGGIWLNSQATLRALVVGNKIVVDTYTGGNPVVITTAIGALTIIGNTASVVSGGTTEVLGMSFAQMDFGNTWNKKIVYGAAAPVAGAWLKGDTVINNAPDSGANWGWVCTTAGTPGTWKAFGTIA